MDTTLSGTSMSNGTNVHRDPSSPIITTDRTPGTLLTLLSKGVFARSLLRLALRISRTRRGFPDRVKASHPSPRDRFSPGNERNKQRGARRVTSPNQAAWSWPHPSTWTSRPSSPLEELDLADVRDHLDMLEVRAQLLELLSNAVQSLPCSAHWRHHHGRPERQVWVRGQQLASLVGLSDAFVG